MDYGDNQSLGMRVHSALVRAAEEKVKALKARKMADRVLDRLFLEQTGSVAAKEAAARTHEKFISAEDAAIDAESAAIISRAEAEGLQIMWETWRSETATTRAEMQLR